MQKLNTKLNYIDYSEQVDALNQGIFEDIFSFLGCHQVASNTYQLRVYLPGAKAVYLIDKGRKTAFQQFELSSLFTLDLHNVSISAPTKLSIDYQGVTHTRFDPYTFDSTLEQQAMYLFNQGTLAHCHTHFGAQPQTYHSGENKIVGTRFCVWAPNAKNVSVIGDFNSWDCRQHVMRKHPASGVWELFIPELMNNTSYKYSILSHTNQRIEKADPFAFQMQVPPHTASQTQRLPNTSLQSHVKNDVASPISIYEVHLGSWRRVVEQGNRFLTYRELATTLIPYVLELNFTHIQLMPISEFPFDGSWGYQPIGLFAPTSRFGDINDFAYFVSEVKKAGLGLLIDWVPGHFPSDPHGLATFDGTHLYEHADKRQGYHPDWHTHIYNYDRAEVRSFLLSNATYWLETYDLDGLRVDAVASMLYLDYSRKEGEWLPNCHGGRENLGAISLLQQINSYAYQEKPNLMMTAEESTAWPGVTQTVEHHGLGFGYKWNMGWMNDSLSYMQRDPIYRSHHHNEMTFSLVYAFSENYILPLSHDEVVHGKGSLINKMPGDDWQKFANLRAFYGFMWAHPGKKLLFMGCEFAQYKEWDHDNSLDWHLLKDEKHLAMKNLIADLNHLYTLTPALYSQDNHPSGFSWIDGHNANQSIFSFVRYGRDINKPNHVLIAISNMTPQVYSHYRIGVPPAKSYKLLLNTDEQKYGGSNVLVPENISVDSIPCHHFEHSIELAIGPLTTLYLVKEQ